MASAKKRKRVQLCEICKDNPAKYKCPRCFCRTCCLACSQKHKAQAPCSGIRDKTAFVDIHGFNDNVIRNDYHFLEEVKRANDRAGRSQPSREPRKQRNREKNFKSEAAVRGVTVRIMPSGMTRHKQNQSYYSRKKKKIYWHANWVFPSALDGSLTISETTICEDTVAHDVLSGFLRDGRKRPETAPTQYRLREYAALSTDQQGGLPYTLLLQLPNHKRKNGNVYAKVDSSLTLTKILANRTVIEFPEFHVVLHRCLQNYDLACSAMYFMKASEKSTDSLLSKQQSSVSLKAT